MPDDLVTRLRQMVLACAGRFAAVVTEDGSNEVVSVGDLLREAADTLELQRNLFIKCQRDLAALSPPGDPMVAQIQKSQGNA